MRLLIILALVIALLFVISIGYFYARKHRDLRKGVTLVTQWYRTEDAARNAEIDKCLEGNARNPYISRFVYFAPEDQRAQVPADLHLRGEIYSVGERMTFQDAFALDAGPRELMIVANSDIIFTPEATRQIIQELGDGEVFAFSRWDCDDANDAAYARAKPFLREDSQDAWAWRGPLKLSIDEPIPLGVWGCDNRIAHEFKQVRRVRNPAKRIKLYHLHPSDFRTTPQSRRIGGSYAMVPPE